MDAIFPIVNHVASARFDTLSSATVANVKRFILDTLAVMIAGARAEGCADVLAYASRWSGKPDAMVVGDLRVPAPYAAMANSMMAHALEFDDTYEPADVHAYAVVLPAVLAAAELNPEKGANGRDLILATALGVDLSYRLGSAIRTYRGWQPTSTCGNLAASLAAARIAQCDRSQTHSAAGIAYGLVAGNFQAVVDASITKRLQPGFSARAAVEAVLLARGGITGARNILEGTFGFFPLYEAGEYDRKALLDGLGSQFLSDSASMKPYPCCRFSHAAIDAVLQILEQKAFDSPAEVDRIEVQIPAETFDYVGRPYSTDAPNPIVAAQFSVPYSVAVALFRGRVGLSDFSLDAVSDPGIVALAKRVHVEPVTAERYGPVTVRLRLKSGRALKQTVVAMKGQPSNPLSQAELEDKARTCLAYGGFSAAALPALVGWVESLESQNSPLERLHAILQGEAAS